MVRSGEIKKDSRRIHKVRRSKEKHLEEVQAYQETSSTTSDAKSRRSRKRIFGHSGFQFRFGIEGTEMAGEQREMQKNENIFGEIDRGPG